MDASKKNEEMRVIKPVLNSDFKKIKKTLKRSIAFNGIIEYEALMKRKQADVTNKTV